LATLWLVTAVGGQTDRGGLGDLVEAALDQQIRQRVEIGQKPIREALAELEKLTGLRFDLHPLAIEWLPYGEQTQVAIVLEDVSVRQALTRICDGLGLRLRVAGDVVVIEPGPVLDRLGRRLTLDETALLQKLSARPWAELKAEQIAIEFRVPAADEARGVLERALAQQAGGSALNQLETATQNIGWFWVPAGKSLVIYPRAADIQQRLDRPLDVNYRRVALDQLLVELGRRIDITVHFEPGALQRVGADQRQVDLIQRNTTVRQILELIVGRTGLWYEVVEDGIVVGATREAPDSGAAEERARVVAILRVPVGSDGTTIDFLLRENELPPEFRALRERKLPEVVELLRRQGQ